MLWLYDECGNASCRGRPRNHRRPSDGGMYVHSQVRPGRRRRRRGPERGAHRARRRRPTRAATARVAQRPPGAAGRVGSEDPDVLRFRRRQDLRRRRRQLRGARPPNGGVYVISGGTATLISGPRSSWPASRGTTGALYLQRWRPAPKTGVVWQLIKWSGWNGTTFTRAGRSSQASKGFDGWNGIGFGADGRLYAGVDVGLLSGNDHGPAKTPLRLRHPLVPVRRQRRAGRRQGHPPTVADGLPGALELPVRHRPRPGLRCEEPTGLHPASEGGTELRIPEVQPHQQGRSARATPRRSARSDRTPT